MTGVLTGSSLGAETEVVAKATRRQFTAAYKRRVLQEADRCEQPGEIGALLRREGLYSSHLTAWRAARPPRWATRPQVDWARRMGGSSVPR